MGFLINLKAIQMRVSKCANDFFFRITHIRIVSNQLNKKGIDYGYKLYTPYAFIIPIM